MAKMTDSFVKSAEIKKSKLQRRLLVFSSLKYFIKKINVERIKTAKRESFLPGIQATAWVKTGCTKKITENKKAIVF